MPFLGYAPDNTFHTLSKQTITGDGGTSYTLTNPVVGSNDIEVFVNNVRQEPSVAYTATGVSLSFTSAVANTDSVYVIYQGKALGLNTVPDGSVTADKLNSTLDLSGKTITNFATTGDVGIGTITPAYKLDVNGTIRATGDVIADSDVRLKSDIQTIANAVETVKSLRGTAYIKDGKASIGVIAQEVEEVLPQVVSTADDEMGTKSVAYGNMVAVLIEAIKEQQEQIDDLKKLLEAK